MKVYFSIKAMNKMLREADLWYNFGMIKEQKPYECVGYPISYTRFASQRSPVEMASLSDIECLVVTHVAIPQDEIKNYGPSHANFKKNGTNLQQAEKELFKRRLEPIFRRFPLLEKISRLHSHPFADKACHSSGDLGTIAKDEINATLQGYRVSFSFLLTHPKKWEMTCFSVDNDGKEAEQEIIAVHDRHDLIIEAKSRPFYNTLQGKGWEDLMEGYAKSNFSRFAKIRQARGWTSWWLMKPKEETLLYIPPLFPQQSPCVYFSTDGKSWQRIEEAFTKKWLEQLSLDPLIRQEVNHGQDEAIPQPDSSGRGEPLEG